MSHLWWEPTSLMKGLLLWWGAYFSDEGLTSLMRGLLLWWDIHPFAKNKKHPYNNILRSTNLWIQQKQKKIRCALKTFEYPCARKLFQKCCQIDKIRLYRLMQKISSLRKKKNRGRFEEWIVEDVFRICCKSILVLYPVTNKIYSSSKRIFLDR